MDEVQVKRCSRCGQDKPATDFYSNQSRADGLSDWCRACTKESQRDGYVAAPQRAHAATMRWRNANREQFNAARRARHHRLRHEVLTAYGGRCTCCGESEEAFLTLEHKNGVPIAHRQSNGKRLSSTDIYAAVKREGFPDDYTILCMNCNGARARLGYCPHEIAEDRLVV